MHADDGELAAEGPLLGGIGEDLGLVDLSDAILRDLIGCSAVEPEGIAEVAHDVAEHIELPPLRGLFRSRCDAHMGEADPLQLIDSRDHTGLTGVPRVVRCQRA